jgi:hypothetical protein
MTKTIAKTQIIIILIMYLISCNSDNSKNYFDITKNSVPIKDKIGIKTNVISKNPLLKIFDSYLILFDFYATDKGVHIFDKNTFSYITSAVTIGEGPGEISRCGSISFDKKNRNLWINDMGKLVLWNFPLDSILHNPDYKTTTSIKISEEEEAFWNFAFLSDSVIVGNAITVDKNQNLVYSNIKYNFDSNSSMIFGYKNEEIKSDFSQSWFDLSPQKNRYVNGYFSYDLLTICNSDGTLVSNIYGSKWGKNKREKLVFFLQVEFSSDKIFASYSGKPEMYFDENERPQFNYPDKIVVFDKNGIYLKTYEIGERFSSFCLDIDNNRIILYYETRENPLGYFNLI